MSLLAVMSNVAWLVMGGVWMAAAWLVAAVVMALTIVGLPWARSALVMARYTLLPFGHSVVDRREIGQPDLGTGGLGLIGNVIWFALAGWWLALGHLTIALGLALTIVGLPFAWAHIKLAGLSLWPVGKAIVSDEQRWAPVAY